ncbi:MAG: InlB B-repeat-containing protein, partial [Lentimicrobiaceae bacterium]|nr:InlB B-repeat-containing protein [Lentimicrobiaceae bacterium]
YYDVTVSVNATGGGTVTGDGNYYCGEELTVIAEADTCYTFLYWTEGTDTVSTDLEYTFILGTSDRDLMAHFELDYYNVTVSVNAMGSGTVTGSGNFYCGDTATITVTPDLCHTFIGWWMPDGTFVSEESIYTFIVTENINLVAHFIDSAKIIVTVNPPDVATITGDGFYPCGETAILTASVIDECFTFVNWTDENDEVVSSNNPYIFTLTDSRTLTANFEPKPYFIYAIPNPSGSGTAEVIGGNIQNCGDTVTVQATPESCYHFVNWTINGVVVSTQLLYEFPVTETTVIFANFAKDTCEIILLANPPAGSTPQPLGSGFYICGSPAVAMALTDPCYTFINWTKNGEEVSTQENYPFTVTESATLIANFERSFYNIDVSPFPTGGGNLFVLGGAENIPCGSERTVLANPNNGYTFVGWFENNILASTDNPWTFEVTENRDLVAHFTLIPYEVIISVQPSQAATFTGNGIYNIGDNATVTIIPNPGGCCNFLYWQENGNNVSVQLSHSFPVTGNHELIAIFDCDVLAVTLSADPPEGGTVSAGGNYICGDTITVTATPENDCWEFVNWTKNNIPISTENPWSFEVTENNNLVANFIQKTYHVTVEHLTGGTVSVEDTTMLCIPGGTYLTVEAFPDLCYTFAGWWSQEGDSISINNPYTFLVTEDRNLVAHFIQSPYDVTVAVYPLAGGEVTGGGNFNCGVSTTVTATTNDCWTFVGWWTQEGDSVSTNNPYTFVVTENINLVAHFEQYVYDVNLSASPSDGGNVTGSGNYNCGDTITVAATSYECWEFVNWTENGIPVSTEDTWRFEVTENHDLVANFIQKTYHVTVEHLTGGIISFGDTVISCVSGGTLIIIEATSDSCHTFAGWWTQNNNFVSLNNPYSIYVTSDTTLVAHFERITYKINVSENPIEGGTVIGDSTYNCGTTATVRAAANPNDCWKFINWTENGEEVSKDNPYRFEVSKDRDLVAHFEKAKYEITLQADPAAGGTVTDSGPHDCGDTITVMARSNPGFIFSEWTINGTKVSDSAEYEFIVTNNTHLIAHFMQSHYSVTVSNNDTLYGTTEPEGTVLYEIGSTARVIAREQNCYSFVNWTTNDGEKLSTDIIYEFVVSKDTTLIANFSALCFDTYCPTLWCNTFMLDLHTLGLVYSEVEDCEWYIDGIKVDNTQTINQFSYSAGPNSDDRLTCNVPYMYKLKFKNRTNWLCSSTKVLSACCDPPNKSPKNLVIFPNPTRGNNSFTVENVIAGETVHIYNQYGIHVKSIIATGDVISMTLNVSSGVYMIRCGERYGKIVIIR